MFVIDDITFEEVNMWGVSGYYSKTENFNTINSLKNFFIENGDYNGHVCELDSSKIELYLYDYKIPATTLYYYPQNNQFLIYGSEGVFPYNTCNINGNTITNNGISMDGAWTFDYIPTTSVEAILFVEFAKQYGVDAIKIDGYSVNWYEEDKIIDICVQNTPIYHIYGAGNGQLSGMIHPLSGSN